MAFSTASRLGGSTSSSSSSMRPSLSASQLDSSVRGSPASSPRSNNATDRPRSASLAGIGGPSSSFARSGSGGFGSNNAAAAAQAKDMAATQRLLKVMQSHPMQRPAAHLPTPHLAPPTAYASAAASRGPRGRSASPVPYSSAFSSRSASRGRAAETEFDVLAGFRRELERVRRDVNQLAHSEQAVEARQRARLAELAATAPANHQRDNSYYRSTYSSRSTDHSPTRSASDRSHASSQIPPSIGLLSTISTLLRSPKLGAGRSMSPPEFSSSSTARSSSSQALAPAPFGLASSARRPSPFATNSPPLSSTRSFSSSSSAAANAQVTSSDPHVASLQSRGASLLGSQAVVLDHSRARLDALLSELHHWKAVQLGALQARVSAIESQFELDRSALEAKARGEIEAAVRAHARMVEQHVQELGLAVEREFKQTGGVAQASFVGSATAGMNGAAAGLPSSSASATRLSSTSRAASQAFDSSMRLEHLDNQNNHKRTALSSDDESQQPAAVEQRRKRLQYAPAVSGAGATAFSRSQPLSSSSSSSKKHRGPARPSVASVLHSSDSEEDEETRTRRMLVAQAQSLASARARRREASVAVALGVSGRSRGRSGARQRENDAAQARQAAEARRMIESSSDEELQEAESSSSSRSRYLPQPSPSPSPARRSFRERVAFVTFASPSRSRPASSPPSSRRRNNEKAQAASVYAASSDEDDVDQKEEPPAPIDAPVARASNGRVLGTPSKTAPSLTQLSSAFRQRIDAIKQMPGRLTTAAEQPVGNGLAH